MLGCGREVNANHAVMWCGRAARGALHVGALCAREAHPDQCQHCWAAPAHGPELGGESKTKNHLSEGQPGTAWGAGLSQHGSDRFEGVLFLPQRETAAAARANQPPFPIQITSYPVLAS